MKLLLITGAGASHNLSLHEDEQLPLMDDWCTRLKNKIGPHLSEMTTLNSVASGVAFEETLGALFRWLETLESGQRFSAMARQEVGPNTTIQGQYQQALRYAQANSDQFVQLLHESLFEEFGPERVDAQKATDAYGSLFRSFTGADDSAAPSELVCATTNYDRSLEMALERLAPRLRTGFTPQLYLSPILEPRGLGEFQENHPALIYLHGAVGWHRTDQGFITSMPADQGYNSTLGRPAVLYPGPDKDIAHLETGELWQEFESAIQTATHVLVLGHDLNDTHLVDALAKAPGRLAITYFLSESAADVAAYDETRHAADEHISKRLPRATLVYADFKPAPSLDDSALKKWWAG